MTFQVEDGTGLANANSYASVAEFDAYVADRGIDVSLLGTTQIKQQKLVQATGYIDLSNRFKGFKLVTTQALQFPRTSLYDCDGTLVASDAIPANVKYAAIEYAVRAATADLFAIPANDEFGVLTAKRVKVGPIEREFGYTGGSQASVNKYPPADNYLHCYINGFGSSYNYR